MKKLTPKERVETCQSAIAKSLKKYNCELGGYPLLAIKTPSPIEKMWNGFLVWLVGDSIMVEIILKDKPE